MWKVVPRLSRQLERKLASFGAEAACSRNPGHLGYSTRRARRFSSSTISSSSVSSREVQKFSEMDKEWWNPVKNPLVAMNPVRIQFMVDTLRRMKRLVAPRDDERDPPFDGLNALDVGCGGGLLSTSLARLGADVTAIDPSTALVECAKQRSTQDSRTKSIDYRGGIAIEDLVSTSEKQYDIICILEVLEHVTNVDSIVSAASSLLKPKGVLFVSTINKTWKSHLMTIVGAEYIMGYLPIGTHDWDKFLSPIQVEEFMTRAKLKQISVNGMVVTTPKLDGTWAWRLDSNNTDVNWIGAYQHDDSC